MNKEKVKQILLENGATVKKHFGQNFLLDENVLGNIVSFADIKKNDVVIEIGPGLGFLTTYLSRSANKVICYEIDSQMVNILNDKKFPNVTIIEKDFLKVDLNESLKEYENVILVANLPYYITTPILLKVLEETKKINKMVVMMQKEVAQRLCGKPSTKDYNALSVLIQYFAEPKMLFNVKPTSFYPEPSVDSSVIEIKYKDKIENEALNLEYFLKFNRNIFAQRRKTLMNNITKSYEYDKEKILKIFDKLSLNYSVRSEMLEVSQIVDLANEFYKTFEK